MKRWLIVALVAGGVLGLIVLIVVTARRPKPEPPPTPVQKAPPTEERVLEPKTEKEQQELEARVEAEQYGAEYDAWLTKNPLMNFLPTDGPHFAIKFEQEDYPNGPIKYFVKLKSASDPKKAAAYKAEAVNWMRSKGEKPERLDITFSEE